MQELFDKLCREAADPMMQELYEQLRRDAERYEIERKNSLLTEFEKMMNLLDAAWYLRSEIVPCLVGPPGIGKTAAVELHARNHGCGKVVKIVASRCIPSETVGMTMPDHENRTMDIYNSMQLGSLRDGDILFLDELLEADQFVLSTLLTVIESREMADGTPLPDIQIVAATNDTIPPSQLKGNIRQRFMFQRFGVSKEQTRQYIMSVTGMDVVDPVLDQLCSDGSDYNFLTPRSLTKLYMWVDAAPDDTSAADVANAIDSIWMSRIGSTILDARRRRDRKLRSPEEQVRKVVRDMVGDDFHDCTMSEMLEKLQSLPEWQDIAKVLSGLEIREEEEEEPDIEF
jgi:hypothetical protein